MKWSPPPPCCLDCAPDASRSVISSFETCSCKMDAESLSNSSASTLQLCFDLRSYFSINKMTANHTINRAHLPPFAWRKHENAEDRHFWGELSRPLKDQPLPALSRSVQQAGKRTSSKASPTAVLILAEVSTNLTPSSAAFFFPSSVETSW